jgi:hypothetical protein
MMLKELIVSLFTFPFDRLHGYFQLALFYQMGIIRLIIYGNILISASAGLLSFGLVSFLNINNSIYYFFTVFFATLFIYNFQRVPRLDEVTDQYSDRHIWLKKNKTILYLLISIGLIGAIVTYFWFLTIQNDFVFLIVIGVIGVLYALKTLNGQALRDLPYIKIHLIAITWVLVIGVWPLIREGRSFFNYIELLLALYFILIAITVPFDIRDLSYDDRKKKTLPQLIGVRLSKVLAAIFLAVGFVFLVIFNNTFLLHPIFYISFLGFFYLILKTSSERKEIYFSGIIDGWIIALAALFLSN